MFGIQDMGIDLGTTNVRVYVKGRGIVLREPTVVAVDTEDRRRVVAVGQEARRMIGRTPGGIEAVRPLQDGVIADFEATAEMLRQLVRIAQGKGFHMGKSRVVICVPCGVTTVERRAVREAAVLAGARKVYIVEQPIAAAVGAGLPIQEPTGTMVVDIGGGTTEVAVLSLGNVVASRSIRIGGAKMDEALLGYLKKEYNLLIGERTAEQIKMDIGSAVPRRRPRVCTLRGRNLVTGLPESIDLDANQIMEAMHEPLQAIVDAVRGVLEQTPPELGADIMQRGIVLTGGGAQLAGMEMLLSVETGMPVLVADKPLDCVIKGIGRMAEDLSFLQGTLELHVEE